MSREVIIKTLAAVLVLAGLAWAAATHGPARPPAVSGDPRIAPPRGGTAKPPGGIPSVDDVVLARVGLGLPSTADRLPTPLFPGNSGDREMVVKLLGWLAKAEAVDGTIGPPGRTAMLALHLLDGSSVSVRAAFDCTTTKRENGTETVCGWARDQLIFQAEESKPVRIRAPELANWLAAGWEADVRRGRPVSCGQEMVEPDYRGYSAAGRDCLWYSYMEGYPAEFSTTARTTEGDPITYSIRVNASHLINLSYDATKDRFGKREEIRYSCEKMQRSLLPSGKGEGAIASRSLTFTGCTGGDSPEVHIPW